MIRAARITDLDALLAIEQQCFATDRLSRRRFRYMMTRAHAGLQVCVGDGVPVAYALLLFRHGSSLARLYSIAVLPALRGHGMGRQLMLAAEQMALEHGCIALRLEVRADNAGSIRLYESMGYRHFGFYGAYYADDMDALRYEKHLQPAL